MVGRQALYVANPPIRAAEIIHVSCSPLSCPGRLRHIASHGQQLKRFPDERHDAEGPALARA